MPPFQILRLPVQETNPYVVLSVATRMRYKGHGGRPLLLFSKRSRPSDDHKRQNSKPDCFPVDLHHVLTTQVPANPCPCSLVSCSREIISWRSPAWSSHSEFRKMNANFRVSAPCSSRSFSASMTSEDALPSSSLLLGLYHL